MSIVNPIDKDLQKYPVSDDSGIVVGVGSVQQLEGHLHETDDASKKAANQWVRCNQVTQGRNARGAGNDDGDEEPALVVSTNIVWHAGKTIHKYL